MSTHKFTLEEVYELVIAGMVCPTPKTILITGQSGIGKTSRIKQQFENKGINVFPITTSALIKSIRTIPDISKGIETVTINEEFLKVITSTKPTLVIIDEIQQAATYNTEAIVILRQLLLERNVYNKHQIPQNVAFIILGNTSEDSGNIQDIDQYLPTMVRNNLLEINLAPVTVDEWINHEKDIEKSFKDTIKSVFKDHFPSSISPREVSQAGHIITYCSNKGLLANKSFAIRLFTSLFVGTLSNLISNTYFNNASTDSVIKSWKTEFENTGSVSSLNGLLVELGKEATDAYITECISNYEQKGSLPRSHEIDTTSLISSVRTVFSVYSLSPEQENNIKVFYKHIFGIVI